MQRLNIILIAFFISSISFAQTNITAIDFKDMEQGMMEEIHTEVGFQLKDCTSDKCVVEVGRIISIDQMVGGSICKVGNAISGSNRIINVERGKIIQVSTYDYTGITSGLLFQGMRSVAVKLATGRVTEFLPMVHGEATLYITSEPSSAIVSIDNKFLGMTPLNTKSDAGSHNVVVKKRDYYGKRLTVKLTYGDKKNIQVELKRHVGLEIYSKPFSAKMFLNGKLKGQTPFQIFDIITETHSVELRKPGYLHQKEGVNIKVDAVNHLNFNLDSLTVINSQIKSLRTKKYYWLGGTIFSAIVGGYFKYSANKHYDEYLTATDDATDLHKTIETEDKIYPVAFVISAACLVPTIFYHISQANLKKKLELSVLPKKDGVAVAVGVKW